MKDSENYSDKAIVHRRLLLFTLGNMIIGISNECSKNCYNCWESNI